MKAKYFYDEVMNKNHDSEGYDGWYCNGSIDIHEIGSTSRGKYCTLYRDGLIISNGKRDYKISDLNGDYEPYSDVQFIKCGYLLFNTSSFEEIKQLISSLANKFEEEENSDIPKENRHPLCGGTCWENGLTERVSYCSPSRIEVSLYSIPEICHKNLRRHRFGKQCLPFNKNFTKENAIYVSFVDFIYNPDLEKRAFESLRELLSNMPNCKWVNMRLHKYIYS